MSKRASALFKNSGALLAIQIANYVLPFLLIPYLTSTLGTSIYGIVAYGISITQIACIITDYGFSLSATYKVARNSENRNTLNETLCAVMLCKALLLVPATLLIVAIATFQSKYSDYQTFFWLLLIPIVGQTFQPIWFFQGIERMGFITTYTISSRLIYFGTVVLWVTSPPDYYLVALSSGIANVSAASIGIYIIFRCGYKFEWCGWRYVLDTFKESTEYFWSRAALATYTSGGAFFLGTFSTPVQVAYYSAAEQLYKGAQSLFSPISQALYPYMAKDRNITLFTKILKLSTTLSIIGLVVGLLTGNWVIETLYGKDFSTSYQTLIIFLITFTISTPSVLLGYPFLGALGRPRDANMSVVIAGLIQTLLLALCYLLGKTLAVEVASTVLTVEIIVLTLRSYYGRRLLKQFKTLNQ